MQAGLTRRAPRRAASLLVCLTAALGAACSSSDDQSSATDSSTADTVVADVGVDTAEPADTASPDTAGGTLATGASCSNHAECRSGLCALGPDGKICVDLCPEGAICPDGSFCGELQGPKATVMACLPSDTTACAPCTTDDDCTPSGEPATCVSLGAGGSYCLLACDAGGGCPSGQVCHDDACAPTSGTCGCSVYAALVEASTACWVENGDGRCDGERVCASSGLSACSAGTPAAEVCNGADDDCDGETDEAPLCDDGDVCTADSCAGSDGCQHAPLTGRACDDADACTSDDTCEAGVCAGKTARDCDDDDPCTTDSCDPSDGCHHDPASGATCDDGSACTEGDTCADGACGGTAKSCDDGDPCTTDACDPAVGCTHAPATGPACDDGDACTSGDACVAGACEGSAISCDDDDECTDDSCLPATGCAHAGRSGACDDGNACTTGDACGEGGCAAAGDLDCDDGDPCTTDACDPDTGCTHTPATGGTCDDGSDCTVNDTCNAGNCVGETASCDDGDPCTADGCDADGGCTHGPLTGGDCSDDDGCTVSDTCVAGACVGQARDCDDDDPCTNDGCSGGACTHDPATGGTCDDHDACTTGDTCGGASGCGGTPVDCDDGDDCTNDFCDPASGCKHTPKSGGSCDDGNACTGDGTCASGFCIPGSPISCDDGNPCTSLACDVNTGCTYANVSGSCDDGDPCTEGGTCQAGNCVATVPADCDDDNPCTSDSCIPGYGCVHAPTGGTCDDGDPCTYGETCVGTTCTPQTTLACDDGNPCTEDACTVEQACSHALAPLSCVDDQDYQSYCEQGGTTVVAEPNDAFESAILLHSGTAVSTVLGATGDVDYFILWVCGERIVEVSLDNAPATTSPADYEAGFYTRSRSRRHLVNDTNGGDATTYLSFNAYVGDAGPVWLRVDDWLGNDFDATQPYKVKLTSKPVPDADLEPNEERASAHVLASGETYTAYIASLDDHDFFAIDVPGERVLRARLSTGTTDTRTDYEMSFYTSSGSRFLTWNDTNGSDGATNLDVNMYIAEAGRVYVEVHDWLDNDWDYDKPYTLTLDVLDVPDADLEPNGNGNFASNSLLATPIGDGAAQAACIASVEDEDWFVLDVPGESILDVQVSNAPALASPVDYEVAIYDESGSRLNIVADTNGGDGPTVVRYNSYAQSAGKYYVFVHDWLDNEWDYARCYTVKVDVKAVPDGGDEPNGISGLATALTPSTPHTAYVASLEDVDWYSFDVPGERIVEVILNALQGPVDYEFTVYQGLGGASLVTTLDTNGADNPTSMRGAGYAPAAGQYSLRVHDWLDNEWGYAQAYDVEVRIHDVPDAAVEPNQTQATGTPIGLGVPTSSYHASDDDNDWWTFTAPAGGTVTVTLTTLVPTATDYEVGLYDANGSRITSKFDSNGGDGPTTLTFTANVAAGAAYGVLVTDFGDDSYDLSIPYTVTVSY